jgi:hypothetical protein
MKRSKYTENQGAPGGDQVLHFTKQCSQLFHRFFTVDGLVGQVGGS